jgi:NADPH:quinone reductase-like Zn-dependent oxidoreductase
MQTAWGSLFAALRLVSGETLLIRGGTTSVGLAAAGIARRHGARVIASTRRPEQEALLRQNGADAVVIDGGSVADAVRTIVAAGADKVLELVGATTLADSLRCVRKGGIVCMTGMVGNRWTIPDFSPMEAIPSTACLTVYDGGVPEFMATPLGTLARQVAEGVVHVQLGPVFHLETIADAHRCMEDNRAGGKIVVLV